MNRVAPPTLPPGDDFDALLRDFFRKEMPAPWPELQAPRAAPPVLSFPPRPAIGPGSRWGRLRSRLALAASIALLIGGTAILPGRLVAPRGERPIPVAPDTGVGNKSKVDDLFPQDRNAPAPKPDSLMHLFEGPDGTGIRIDVVPPVTDK